MCPIIHVEMIVAVELQQVEVQHEPLQYAVRLKRHRAVQVAFVARPEHAAVHLAVLSLEEVVLAYRLHVIEFALLGMAVGSINHEEEK